MSKKPFTKAILASLIALFIALFTSHITPAYAKSAIAISPMYQNKVLVPGRKELGSFTIYNPGTSTSSVELEIDIKPFWPDENNDVEFTAHEYYSQIIDWTTIDKTSVILKPNEKKEISFEIDVPEDAPAGGQYISFVAHSVSQGGGMINEVFEMAHLVYAEVAGQTVRGGEISNLQLSSFIFGGKITAGATVKNNGNVHAKTKQTLKIRSFFGNGELFSNEESPQENIVMPGATRYTGIAWDDTPSIGIFRATYIVEFEGVKKELEKVIIICPLWLLIVILLLIATIVFRFITGSKSRKKAKKETPAEAQ